MRRGLLLILLAGCAVTPDPTPTEPATSGGTLYVIDTTLDLFDDLSVSPDPIPGPTRIQCVGEQAMRILLRQADRGKGARHLGRAWADLESGRPAEFKVDWPLEYLEPVAGGRFEVRTSAHAAWISNTVTPVLSNDEKYVTLQGFLRRVVPFRTRLDGTDLDVGDSVEGSHTIPIGSALAISIRGDSDRLLLVLLHVASVRAP